MRLPLYISDGSCLAEKVLSFQAAASVLMFWLHTLNSANSAQIKMM